MDNFGHPKTDVFCIDPSCVWFLLVDLLYKSTNHKEHTDEHPGCDGSGLLSLRCVCDDSVEDVDENQEESDEQYSPTGDSLCRDEEGDPGDNHEDS